MKIAFQDFVWALLLILLTLGDDIMASLRGAFG